jgi:hypothetical protein
MIFSRMYPEGSNAITEIVSLLESEGLQPFRSSTDGKYKITRHRLYENSDFVGADYLRMSPKEWVSVGEEGRDAAGRVIIDAKELDGEFTTVFRSGFSKHDHFVSQSVKEVLDLSQFRGLRFRETVWADPIRDFKRERVWELYSDIVLPKLSNIHNLVHARNEPFTKDYSRPIWIREAPYAHGGGELHFRASEILAVTPFDLAHTFELHLGPRYSLVASQRLYQDCCEHKLPFEWQPVRVDAD